MSNEYTPTTLMTQNITINSFCLDATGITINYTENGTPQILSSMALGACFLLERAGYITRYRFKRRKLYVTVAVTEDTISSEGVFETREAGHAEITWDFFARNYDLDEGWCMDIAPYKRAHDLNFLSLN